MMPRSWIVLTTSLELHILCYRPDRKSGSILEAFDFQPLNMCNYGFFIEKKGCKVQNDRSAKNSIKHGGRIYLQPYSLDIIYMAKVLLSGNRKLNITFYISKQPVDKASLLPGHYLYKSLNILAKKKTTI